MTKKKQELTFEEALARLEELTHALERGDLMLEEALAYFKEGSHLLEHCKNLLNGAEEALKILDLGQLHATQQDPGKGEAQQ